MFERFTDDAREVVKTAQVEARTLRHARIGTEHLLLGMLADPTSPGGAALAELGLSVEDAREAIDKALDTTGGDAAALETVGIDLDRVRASVEAAFGEGALERAGRWRFSRRAHIPFTKAAKKALELSLREALRLHDKHIGTEHILLGLLRGNDGLGAAILADVGVDHQTVEALVTRVA